MERADMSGGSKRILIEPGAGKEVWLGGVGVVFKMYAEDTGGAFSVVEHPVKPGRLVPPHVHKDTDEFSYVLQGEIGAKIGDQEIRARRGSYLSKPRGIPHTFWNAGKEPARLLELLSPPRFIHFFEEAAELFPGGDGPPDLARLAALANKYGTTLIPDWIPTLEAKYKVKL